MALDLSLQLSASPFYVTGGTLPATASSYVERQADKDLLDSLQRGEYCYVLNTRQMGKSSLMVRTAARLRQAGVTVAVLDLTAVGQNLQPEQWYSGLLTRLGQQLDLENELEDFWDTHPKLGPMQRFLGSLREVVLPRISTSVIIFVDEIDAVRSLPFPADEFFAGIRECYNRRTQEPEYERLTFCLLGVATPADLITEMRMSPFNVGKRITLTDFTHPEALALVEGLNPRDRETQHRLRGEEESKQLLERVLYWSGGHPYITQRLCQAIVEAGNITQVRQVDTLCEQLFLTKAAQDTDDNLSFVRNRLLRSEVDLAALLDLYTQVRADRKIKDDETNPLIPVLRLSGVVKIEKGLLKVRNRIYDRVFDREWVIAHMPDAELRRQRAAYRSGVLRTASVAGAVILAMGMLAVTALLQANRANRETKRANDREEQTRNLSVTLQEQNGQLQAANTAEKTATQRANANALLASQRAEALRTALMKADSARREADENSTRAEFQKALALKNSAESRTRLIRLNEETGTRLRSAGDLMGALPWFVEAQKLEGNSSGSQRLFELRLANILQGLPRLTQTWKQEAWVFWGAFSPDGERITTLGTDGLYTWDRAKNTRRKDPRSLPTLGDLVVSKSGNRYLTRQPDGTVQAWEMTTGKRVGPSVHRPKTATLVLSPTGNRAGAFHTGDAEMTVWEVDTGREHVIHLLPNRTISAADFDPTGTRLAVGVSPRQIQIRDMTNGRILDQQLLRGNAETLLFSPEGSSLAYRVVGNSNVAYLWKFGDPEPKLLPDSLSHFDDQLRFSPDGKRIAGTLGNFVKVWDAQTGAAVTPMLKMDSLASNLIFSEDGRRLAASGTDRVVQVWDIGSNKLVCSPLHNEDVPLLLTFSPDGRYLLSGCINGSVRVWDTLIGNDQGLLLHNASRLMTNPYSRDGKRLLVSLSSRPAGVFDTHTGQLSLPPFTSEGRVTSAMFSPDGKRIATGDNHGLMQYWDANTGKKQNLSRHLGDSIIGLEFSPDGHRLLLHYQQGSGSPTVTDWIQLLDAATLAPCCQPIPLQHLEDRQTVAAQFSPDGRRFLVLENAYITTQVIRLRLFDAMTGKAMARITVPNRGAFASAAFSPDSRLVALAGEGCRIYQVEKGTPVGPSLPIRYISAIAFGPDNRLATATIDGIVQLWDVRTGSAVLPPMSHDKLATQCAFSKDGRLLFVCALGSLRVWDAQTGQLVATLTDTNAFQFALSPDEGSVAVLGGGGVSILGLHRDAHSLAEATALSELLTCARMEGGWQHPLGSDALARRWRELQSRHPNDFSLPPAQALARYNEQATQFLNARQWEEALPYLNARVDVAPQNMGFRVQRSEANAALQHWKEVVADLETAVQQNPDADLTTWHNLALAYLAANEPAGYHRTCEMLWKRYGAHPKRDDLSRLAWTFHLGPGALSDYSGIIAQMEKAFSQLSDDDKMSLGALYYRAGRYRDAIRLIQAIAEKSPGAYFDAPLYLAMAHEQLGQKPLARRYMIEAQGGGPSDPETSWILKMQFQLQLREARVLLNMP